MLIALQIQIVIFSRSTVNRLSTPKIGLQNGGKQVYSRKDLNLREQGIEATIYQTHNQNLNLNLLSSDRLAYC